MTISVNWSYPTNIRFGPGRIQELGEVCLALNIKNPLLSGFQGRVFSDVDPNPNEINLEAGIIEYQKGNHDGVIAFGGGSGIDLGKMIAFMAGQTRPIWDFEDIGDWWTRADSNVIAPIVAVPTTAGTGSEVGRASVITNSETHEKKII
ncbi:MAG: iron-containing alcohol dehydrogenase, partial [Rhodobacterales bacterium]|nr:iron-containing alcohol dehydrogenase [Rhodobacterales bacterium]